MSRHPDGVFLFPSTSPEFDAQRKAAGVPAKAPVPDRDILVKYDRSHRRIDKAFGTLGVFLSLFILLLPGLLLLPSDQSGDNSPEQPLHSFPRERKIAPDTVILAVSLSFFSAMAILWVGLEFGFGARWFVFHGDAMYMRRRGVVPPFRQTVVVAKKDVRGLECFDVPASGRPTHGVRIHLKNGNHITLVKYDPDESRAAWLKETIAGWVTGNQPSSSPASARKPNR